MNTNKLSIKQASIAFDTFINEGGIGAAMFFVLLELIAVNTSSLWYVFGFDGWYNIIWSVVGALGFSIVTTVVIRKQVPLWLKYSFPLFDVLLVFTGMNINYWGHMLDNPLRLIVTIIFSLFTGAVLVALGLINYGEQKTESNLKLLKDTIADLKSKLLLEKETTKLLESELSIANSDIELLQSNLMNAKTEISESESYYNSIQSNMDNHENESRTLHSQIHKYETDLTDANSKITENESELESLCKSEVSLKGKCVGFESKIMSLEQSLDNHDLYKETYYRSEQARILKKKPENITEEEQAILIVAKNYD